MRLQWCVDIRLIPLNLFSNRRHIADRSVSPTVELAYHTEQNGFNDVTDHSQKAEQELS